ALPRRGAQRGRNDRRRAVHLFGGVAGLRRGAPRGGRAGTLAGGALRVRRGGHPDRAEGLPGRHARPHRHLPGALLHRPRRRAAGNCLAVSAAAVSAPRGGGGGLLAVLGDRRGKKFARSRSFLSETANRYGLYRPRVAFFRETCSGWPISLAIVQTERDPTLCSPGTISAT